MESDNSSHNINIVSNGVCFQICLSFTSIHPYVHLRLCFYDQYISPSLCPFIHWKSPCTFVHPSFLNLGVHLSVCPPGHPSVNQSIICLSITLSIHLSIYPSICLSFVLLPFPLSSTCPSICLSLCLSISFPLFTREGYDACPERFSLPISCSPGITYDF